jgi:hypothetical protein
MIAIEVIFYAQLKDYFGDKLTVELPDYATPAEIRAALTQKNALAADWLKVSRLAEDHQLVGGGMYFLLPPSSGG